jgi:hypothetical protein
VGRHGRRAALIAAICALTLALAAPIAFAVPEIGDAGEVPLTAQEPGPQGQLTSIGGTLTSTLDRDMYKVCLTGGGFSASTVDLAGFDTQLFLFDAQGRGVYANDDHRFQDNTAVAQSELPANHELTPTAPGVYYLAISAYDWDPTSAAGLIFESGSGVVAPIASRAGLPVTRWMTLGDTKPGGAYTIALTGTRSCVDTTPPTIELGVPADGAQYARGAEVPAKYSCTDEQDGSGLAYCKGSVENGQPIDTATLGTKTFTVTAGDNRGNLTTVTRSYQVVDGTSPTVRLDSPADGAEYARDQVVLADYACADEVGGSGLASCEAPVPDDAAIDTATLGEKTFTVTAVDGAGNRTSVTHRYTVVDVTAPTVVVRSPQDGATFAPRQRVLADYDCADEAGGSGLVSCVGDRARGARIDTSRLGEHSFTVRAEDAAGNVTTETVTYRVEGRLEFDFEGFFPPVANRPRVNVVSAGRVVPMTFSLGGWEGWHVIARGYPRSREMHCGSKVELDGGDRTRFAGGTPLRYTHHGERYSYLWKTERDWAGTCRQFILKLSDGSYHRADFRFFGSRPHHHDRWN